MMAFCGCGEFVGIEGFLGGHRGAGEAEGLTLTLTFRSGVLVLKAGHSETGIGAGAAASPAARRQTLTNTKAESPAPEVEDLLALLSCDQAACSTCSGLPPFIRSDAHGCVCRQRHIRRCHIGSRTTARRRRCCDLRHRCYVGRCQAALSRRCPSRCYHCRRGPKSAASKSAGGALDRGAGLELRGPCGSHADLVGEAGMWRGGRRGTGESSSVFRHESADISLDFLQRAPLKSAFTQAGILRYRRHRLGLAGRSGSAVARTCVADRTGFLSRLSTLHVHRHSALTRLTKGVNPR